MRCFLAPGNDAVTNVVFNKQRQGSLLLFGWEKQRSCVLVLSVLNTTYVLVLTHDVVLFFALSFFLSFLPPFFFSFSHSSPPSCSFRPFSYYSIVKDMLDYIKTVASANESHGKALGKAAEKFKNKNAGTSLTSRESMAEVGQAMEGLSQGYIALAKELLEGPALAINSKLDDLKKELNELSSDAKKMEKAVVSVRQTLAKAHKSYMDAAKDADNAITAAAAAEDDEKKGPKLAAAATKAKEKASAAHEKYLAALDDSNEKSRTYYEEALPNIMDRFQKADEERMEVLTQSIKDLAGATHTFAPAMRVAKDAWKAAADSVDSSTDIDKWIEESASGEDPPPLAGYSPYEGENEVHDVDDERSTEPPALNLPGAPKKKAPRAKRANSQRKASVGGPAGRKPGSRRGSLAGKAGGSDFAATGAARKGRKASVSAPKSGGDGAASAADFLQRRATVEASNRGRSTSVGRPK